MIRRLKVGLAFQKNRTVPVGEMLRTENGVIYFQFDSSFLRSGLPLSPFKLKAIPEPQTPSIADAPLFDGLFGSFADSLPDGWGLMMMSRAMKKLGMDFSSSSALDRLSFVGRHGMGALVYEPVNEHSQDLEGAIDLSSLAAEANRVLEGKSEDVLPELLALGGSPGGARPKVLVGVEKNVKNPRIISGVSELPDDFEHWIVKFKGNDERPDAGIVEYIYSLTAQKIGLQMPETRLFTDKKGQYWFGVKRFDRDAHNKRIHMHSVAGLVHANFRLPALDYEELLKITRVITRREDDLISMFRLAVFNVVFHNRDDHAKNFAFLMSEKGDWRLAPAYDLSWSSGPEGEHTAAVLGEGKFISSDRLLNLALKAGLSKNLASLILTEVEAGVITLRDLLKQYQIKSHPILEYLNSTKR